MALNQDGNDPKKVTEENEEKPVPGPSDPPVPLPPASPVEEEIDNHETVPAWFAPYASQLESIHSKLTGESKPEPEPESKPEEVKEDATQKEKPKSRRVKIFRLK